MADEEPQTNMDEGAPPSEEQQVKPTGDAGGEGEVIGSAAMRPVFLGNLKTDYSAAEVSAIFTRPIVPPGTPEGTFTPIPVDRCDLKRGYCFVFLKDAASQADKERAEKFVSAINAMEVENVSIALRAEFARGDGRVKRKEDDRRRNIAPSETLFVVNFHEETTKREDLQMLFEPFGELVRIDMKRNYAFVQFRTIEEAQRAKEVTNGGKLDQSVLTVEYVARQRGDQDGPRGGGAGGGRRRGRDDRRGGDRGRGNGGDRGGDRGGPRGLPYDNNRGNGPPERYGDSRGGDRGGGDRYDDNRGRRDRSPMGGGGYRGGSPGGGGGYRRRSRSRSRSPRGYRSRSPPRNAGGGGRYDDRGDRGGGARNDGSDRGGGARNDGGDRGGPRNDGGDRGGPRNDGGDRGGPRNDGGDRGGARNDGDRGGARNDDYRDRSPDGYRERDGYRGGRDDRGYRP